jgi:hypothetical protein
MYSPQLPLARASSESPHADPGDLEASLLQLVHDHHHASLRLRDHTGQSDPYIKSCDLIGFTIFPQLQIF